MAGGTQDIRAVKKTDSEYIYQPDGQQYTFREGGKPGRHCIKNGDAELASGAWNTLELYTHGDTSVHVVNGKVMMVLTHSGQSDNGVITPLTKGKLQIQSEGAEVFYKNIMITPIESIPTELLR